MKAPVADYAPHYVDRGPAQKVVLYEEVAARIARLIDEGTFPPGHRIPSVRCLSQQFRVSITTVMEAYRLLEDRGLIEARPQSGYYVQPRFPEAICEPEISQPAGEPTHVSVCALAMQVMQHTADKNLLQLGAAIPNPDLLPLDRLSRTLAAVVREKPVLSSAYDTPAGCDPLRVQIARRGLLAGCALTPDDIITTVGSQEAIHLCLRATCRPGDTVAIESPMYYGILQAIEGLGLRALEIATHPRDGMDLDMLRHALAHNAIQACVVISNYNNPLGSCMPDARKKELVVLLAEHGIPLIEDDVGGDLGFGPERPTVCKAYDDQGLVLLCSSFSKTIAPGYRVGWMAPGRFKSEVEHLKLVSSFAAPTPTQLAVAEFLRSGGYDHHLRRIRRLYAQQTAQMAQTVSAVFPEGTKVTRPGGGYVLWVEMPEYADSIALYALALRAGMTLAPGTMFSAAGKYRNFIRLNAAYWSPRIEGALATLGQIVAGMEGNREKKGRSRTKT